MGGKINWKLWLFIYFFPPCLPAFLPSLPRR